MDLFTISQLEQFSGIKMQTIRVWERRYNALKPHRSEGNTRYYDGEQLRRLLNIVSLMDFEYKVSQLCVMPDEKLHKLLQEELEGRIKIDEATEIYISQLISAGMNYDEVAFETTFNQCLQRFGMRDTYVKIIYPLLQRIGLLWANNTLHPAHEHFMSNIVRRKLFSSIDALPIPAGKENSWLLFLPENELHETGLLFSHYIIRQGGKRVFYIGTNVPMSTLISAIEANNPQNLLLFLVNNNIPEYLYNYLEALKKNFTKTNIFISGNEKLISQMPPESRIKWIRTVEELEKEVA